MQSHLQHAVDTIRVRFGDQALVRATRLPAAQPWTTGQAALDRLSGIGGLPRGRLSLLVGSSSSGRLSLGLALLARATREFAHAVVLDPEGVFDPCVPAPLGADLAGLTVVRPPSPAASGEAAATLARAGAGFLLVMGEMAESGLAPLEAAAARSGCVVVMVAADGTGAAGGAVAGGRGLAFASSLTLGFQRTGWIEERGQLVGLRVRVRCLKNKLAAPGGEAELEVRYPIGPGLPAGAPVREVGDVRMAS
jgi:recombination protein RecA